MQQTLNEIISFEGSGLHTGLFIHMTVEPADANHGIQIARMDLDGCPVYPAVADYVSATERGTVLENGVWRVSTVEHLLSALSAMGVDNALIKVDAPEVPILDGSARYYVEAIERVGLREQEAEREVYAVSEKIEYDNGNGSHLSIVPDNNFSVEVRIGYDSPILSSQIARVDLSADYPTEIAPARTFCFVREIEPLLDRGLIKGGNLDNALVIYDKPISQDKLNRLADLCHVRHIPADKLGYLSEPKYQNEAARHKLLDVIGDLALVGKPLQGRVTAEYPGHGVNTAFAKKIREIMRQNK